MTTGTGSPQGTPPSIFNDVIGPVMRGPSSSHCAAALRIGRLARDLMGGRISGVLVEFHPGGSLATTHQSQGSDMGLFGGLMGWDATDPRLVGSTRALEEAGIRVDIRITDFPASHPNTYRLTLRGPEDPHSMTALSTGGGMIEVVEVDGAPLSMAGDCHETLLFLRGSRISKSADLLRFLGEQLPTHEVLLHEGPDSMGGSPGDQFSDVGEASLRGAGGRRKGMTGEPTGGGHTIIRIKGRAFPPAEVLEEVASRFSIREIRTLAPVLPVQSPRTMDLPFLTTRGLSAHNDSLAAAGQRRLDLWELAVLYERARGGISGEEVMERMRGIAGVMEGAIREGLQGTEYADRILGAQSGSFRQGMESGRLLDAGLLNRIILYVTAVMEVKSSMGVIVAAPTAGACGALPGVCVGAAHAMGLSLEDVSRAVLAAGMVGVFITARSTFAAEVCGCQAECGAASGMAAAALITLAGGTTEEALAAASMALQNTLGLICDPVANRVEVPCLGRNVMAAANALSCANMALAGYDAVIPLDEVIAAMDEVGRSLPHALRCTGLGGLSVTQTARSIERGLGGESARTCNVSGPVRHRRGAGEGGRGLPMSGGPPRT